MRKLLNTVYVTNEMAYLTLDGENLVCKIDGETKLRIPFENIENIVCFNYIGCSPALMGNASVRRYRSTLFLLRENFLQKSAGRRREMYFFEWRRSIRFVNQDLY